LRPGRRRGGVLEWEDGEDIGNGDPSVRKVRRDEEAVPKGCEGADVEQTVSFRVRTDGCGTKGGQSNERERKLVVGNPSPLTTTTWRWTMATASEPFFIILVTCAEVLQEMYRGGKLSKEKHPGRTNHFLKRGPGL